MKGRVSHAQDGNVLERCDFFLKTMSCRLPQKFKRRSCENTLRSQTALEKNYSLFSNSVALELLEINLGHFEKF